MRGALARSAFTALLALVAACPIATVTAQDWSNLATVSMTNATTPKLTNRYVCYTDSRDIRCDSPSLFVSTGGLIGINTTNPQTQLEVNGTISATNFVGDGSGLSGVMAGSSDRIVSGSTGGTRVVAISDTGYISITQAGANSAWFDPYQGLVVLGVSATGKVSASGGYFSGRVGIGTTTPTQLLNIVGPGVVAARIETTDAGRALVSFSRNGVYVWDTGVNNNNLGTNDYQIREDGSSVRFVIQDATGNVGIGTTNPTARLDVNGTISSSNAIQLGQSTLTCAVGISGSIRFEPTSNTIQVCTGSTGWKSLASSTVVSGGTGLEDRIVSGTTNVNAYQDRSVTISTAGTQRMIIGENGSVGIGTMTPGALPLQVSGSALFGGPNSGAGYSIITQGTVGSTGYVGFYTSVSTRIGFVGFGSFGNRLSLATDGATPLTLTVSASEAVRITPAGDVGIGLTTPAAKLQVSGSFIVSTTQTGDDPALYVSGTTGRVGIGTTTPLVPFDVSGSIAAAGYIVGGSRIYLGYNSNLQGIATTGQILMRYGNTIAEYGMVVGAGGSNNFRINDVKNGGANRFIIDNAGNIGISKSTPIAKLDVMGTISASDAIQVGQSALACASGISGSVRYNTTSDTLQICTGSGWKSLTSSSVAGATTVASSTGAIQFNVANALAGDTANLFWDDTNNRLGLGTGAPAATLQVSGSFIVSTSAQDTTPSLYVGTNGFVGIGTISPSALLDISSTRRTRINSAGVISIQGDSNGWATRLGAVGSAGTVYGGYGFLGSADALTYYWIGINHGNPSMVLLPNGNIGISKTAPVAKLDVAGTISASDAIQVGQSALTCASGISGSIRYNSTSDTLQICTGSGWKSLASTTVAGSGTGLEDRIVSGTTNVIATQDRSVTISTAGMPRMIIGENGSVGIGTSAPTGLLHIMNAQGGRIIMDANITSGYDTRIDATDVGLEFTAKSSIRGFAFNTGVTPTAKIRIDSLGNVGIGRTNPLAKLDVVGTISSSDAIQVGQSALACAVGISGSIRFEPTSNTIQVCTGATGWKSLASSTTAGGGTPAGSTGDIQFNTGGGFAADTGQLFWDATNNRLGIGTGAPGYALHLSSTIPAIELQDGDHVSTSVSVWGHITFRDSGNSQYGYLGDGSIGNNYMALYGGPTHGVKISGGAVNAITVDTSGNVGVGEAVNSPTATLQVSGSFIVSTSAQTTTPSLYVGTNGNVGIGTDDPTALLEIAATNASPSIRVGNLMMQSFVVNNEWVSQNLYFNGAWRYGANGFGVRQYFASGNFQIDTAPSNASGAGAVATITNRFYVANTGNVGISKTTPLAKLDVMGTISASDAIQLGQNTIACAAGISGSIRYNTTSNTVQFCNGTNWASLSSNTAATGGTPVGSTGDIQFNNAGSFAADTGQLFWDATNNRLGIGTTVPQQALDVDGIIRAGDVSSCAGATALAIRYGTAAEGSTATFGSEYSECGPVFGRHVRPSTSTSAAFISANPYALSRSALALGTELRYYTGPAQTVPIGGAVSMTERFRIDASGNVGIGTSVPGAPLHISAAAGNNLRLMNPSSAGDPWNYIEFYNSTNRRYYAGADNNGNFIIQRDNAAGHIALNPLGGNVGIGTASPVQQLHVHSASTDARIQITNSVTGATGGDGLMLEADPIGHAYIWQFENQPMFIGTNNVARIAITAAGNVGIGTTTPNQGKVEVKGGSVCVDTNSDDNATQCIASESDARLKQNIQPMRAALETLAKLRGVSFDWRVSDTTVLKHYPLISRFANNPHSVGVIAQEVEEVYPVAIEPETVGDDEVEYKQVDYTKFTPLLIEGIKELKAANDNLVTQTARLKAANYNMRMDYTKRLDALEADLRELKATGH